MSHSKSWKPALSGAEKFTRAPEQQVLFGDFEAIIGGGNDFESSHRLWGLRLTKQKTMRSMVGASHASPQLVKLCESKSIGIFNYYDSRIGHVKANLDDSCRNENLNLVPAASPKRFFPLVRRNPAVQSTNLTVRKGPLIFFTNPARIRNDTAYRVRTSIYFRTHHKYLPSQRNLISDKCVYLFAIFLLYVARLHCMSSRRIFIDEYCFEVAVQRQCQRTRNRGCGHNHQVAFDTFCSERRSLIDAEPVLFVYDDQAGIPYSDLLFDKRMRADY